MTADTAKPTNGSEAAADSKAAEPEDQLVTTAHSIQTESGELSYTVTTGRVVLREEVITDGKFDGHQAKAEMFITAYTLDSAIISDRPVTFAFNGGPGSSSVWLHLGLLGPRRVVSGDVDTMVAPPFGLTDNAETLLSHTDLVFIDPVSTGYSRTISGGEPKKFHGFGPDRDSVGELIRLWTSRNGRWLSPKFLAGESYGTTRAAALASHLSDRYGMAMNGVILISSVLDMGSVFFTDGNDLPYVTFLPTYAALAHYHGMIPDRSQQEVLAAAEALAERDYPWALSRGARLPEAERADMVGRLSAVTGLSADYIDRADLRIEHQHFFAELLRHRGLATGRLDGRFTAVPKNRNASTLESDPSYDAIRGPYSAAANHYLRVELGYEVDLPYEILTDKVWPWSYSDFENRAVSVAQELATAIRTNPFLKVHVAFGYQDGATPYYAAEHVLAQLNIPESLRENISRKYYQAGHMMYVHEESRLQQSADLAQFITWATGGPRPID